MPLLAMLTPPIESWLERRGIAGAGDAGNSPDKGETSNGLTGLDERLLAVVITSGGGASARWGRETAGLGCVTGAGRMVP